MPTSVDAICAALAAQIGTQTGLRSHGTAPGAISPPAAVVIPARPAIIYGVTMDGEVTVNLLVIVAVSAANDQSGQDQLMKYISPDGAQSILQAVDTDPTFGGTCEFGIVKQVSTYGIITYAGQQYMGASFMVECGAHL